MTSLLVSFFLFQVIDSSSGTRYRIDTDLALADTIFIGEGNSDYSGFSISCAGDVNGDDIDDILIGAYGKSTGQNAVGKTYLIFGNTSGFQHDYPLSQADSSFIGESSDDWSGYSISGGGDVNGDGFDDILIGAPHNDVMGSDSGHVYLIFGKETGWTSNMDLANSDASFMGEFAEDRCGSSISSDGDVNGDGFDDILISSPGNDKGGNMSGKIYLILGKETGWTMGTDLDEADATFYGKSNFDVAGIAVSLEGDVNGDGYDDILIGTAASGETYLMFGSTSGLKRDTNLSDADASLISGGRAGRALSSGGDVNNDGFDDILIGADLNSEAGTNAGKSYLVLGMERGWSKGFPLSNSTASFLGEAPNDSSGTRVSIMGDTNGDGFDDLLVGAFQNDEGGSGSGQAYLFFGKRSGWEQDISLSEADLSFQGEEDYHHAGLSSSGSGDVNGDGFHDVLIGAYWAGSDMARTGRTYLTYIKSRPTPPEDVWAELSVDGSYLGISWSPAFYVDNITGYRVYRSENGVDYPLIGRTPDDTFSFMDRDVIVGSYYHYRVNAVGVPNMESEFSGGISLMNDMDTDGDRIGNSVDQDDDDDGYPDVIDPFPSNSSEWMDTDDDGIGNHLDTDDDNDGLPDVIDPDPLSSIITVMKLLGAMDSTLENLSFSIDRIRTDLEYFMDSTHDRLLAIKNDMVQYGVDIMSELDIMIQMVDDMEADVLDNLSMKLIALAEVVDENNTQLRNDLLNLQTSVESFKQQTLNGLSYLSLKVATTEEMNRVKENISGLESQMERLDGIEEDLSGISRDQSDIEDRIAVSTIQLWILIILLIVLVAVTVAAIIRMRRMGSEDSWDFEDDNE